MLQNPSGRSFIGIGPSWPSSLAGISFSCKSSIMFDREMRHPLRITCILSFFLMCLSIPAAAQRPESFAILLDKTAYVSGDHVWYSVYVGGPAPRSKIIHAELWNGNQQRLLHQQLRLNGREAKGYFRIPAGWEEGVYMIRITSFWNQNFGDSAQAQRFFTLLGEDFAEAIPAEARPEFKPAGNLAIIPEDSIWKTRSTQKVRLELPAGSTGQFTVKVLASEYTPLDAPGLEAQWQSFSAYSPIDSLIYLPQTEFALVGTAQEPLSQKPLVSTYLALWSVDSANNRFLTCLNGEFSTKWPAYAGEQSFQVFDFSPLHDKRPNVALSFAAPAFPPPALSKFPKVRSEADIAYAVEQGKKLRLDRLFGVQTIDGPRPQKQALISPWKADRRYFAEKYIRFEFLEGFFREGAPYINVVEKKGKRSLKMDNFETKLAFEESPLFLVDHYIHFGDQAILKFPWDRILYIDQYYFLETLKEEFGLLGRYGAISIYTLDGQTPEDFTQNENTFVLEGLHLAPAFDELTQVAADKRTPRLAPLLHWGTYAGQRSIPFEVKTGDRKGIYWIDVQGVTENGQAVSARRQIVIR